MRHRTVYIAIASAIHLAAALGPSTKASDRPTVHQVLDRFVEAVGGPAAFERLEVRSYRGTIVQDLTWTDPRHQETPFVAEADASGRVRYAETDDWSRLPGEDNGEPRRKIRWLMHPRFPLVVEQFFPELEVRGREIREGRRVLVVAPGDLAFEHYALYFDEETGLLSHVGYHNDVEGWRPVGDTLFPSRWVFGRKGGHTTYHVDSVSSRPIP